MSALLKNSNKSLTAQIVWMCVSHWQASEHYFFVMFRDQSSEESTAHRCATLAISAWRSALGSTRLWRAGERVLAIANFIEPVFFTG